ncbi:MAG: hypothetical protein ACK5DN_09330, partial [Hyphomonadaceae bacterium]
MTADDAHRNLASLESIDQALLRSNKNLGRWGKTNEAEFMMAWITYRFEHNQWQIASRRRATPPRQPVMSAQLTTWVTFILASHSERDMDIWTAVEICDALDFNWHKIPPDEMEDALLKVEWIVDTLDDDRLKSQFPMRPNPRNYLRNQIHSARHRFKEDFSDGKISLTKRGPGRPPGKLEAEIEAMAVLAIEQLNA